MVEPRLETAEIPELFQLSAKKDLAELGKTKFGKLVLKLGKKGYFSNFEEAKEILCSVWDEITQDEINNMIKGLKGRAEDVVFSQGRFREGQSFHKKLTLNTQVKCPFFKLYIIIILASSCSASSQNDLGFSSLIIL
jgi:hypothetical protein